MSVRTAILMLCAGLASVLAGDARGSERLARHISDIPGFPAGITDVGQDTTGYLWLSSREGLSRYDGLEVRSWGREITRGVLTYVSTGPRDLVLSGDRHTGLFEVDGGTLRKIEPPGGSSDPGAAHAVYDNAGTLWAAWDGRLLRRRDETWIDIGNTDIHDEFAHELAVRDNGGVIVGTIGGTIWTVDADGGARRIAGDLGGRVTQILDDPDGPVAVIRFGPRPGFIRVTGQGVEYLLDWSGRCEGLERRGSSYWISYASGVWAVHDDGTREFLSTKEGFSGGGNISIDREDGLWVASNRGLSHYPQPETRIWTELSGLPHVSLRSIHPVSDGYFLTSWWGPMHLDSDGRGARDVDLGDLFSRDIGCPDPWGGVWLKAFPEPPSLRALDEYRSESAVIMEWRDGTAHRRKTSGWYRGDLICDSGAGDSFWILAHGELMQVTAPGAELTLRGRLSHSIYGSSPQRGLVVRRDGSSVVVAFASGEVCEAPLEEADVPIVENAWDCETLTEPISVTDLIETPSGGLWLTAAGGGVFEKTTAGWRRVPGELSRLPAALGLERSPLGGLWVLGWRERWRVEESTTGGPPTVVERLGTAHGIPAWQNSRGFLEEVNGTVWVPMFSGLVRVPAEVRSGIVAVPSVTLTGLVADGRQVTADEPFELRHGDHSLEIRWSALSFRDPTQVRYRMRLDTDADWTVLHQPFVRLAGLGSGRHRLELGASLDGRTWTDRPEIVDFTVSRAWFMQSWFLLLIVGFVLTVTTIVWRLRLAHLLRLERQRTRIAMDLHDGMGAGLGSTGLLVGLLGEGDLEDGERQEIGERAARQLKDLGESLADIVWSLRPGTGTLDALLLFLRQRAADLFPAEGGTRVRVDGPDPCPEFPLGLPLRRNVQWIAVEALHNAARHAEARRVLVRLRPDGDDWVLSVRDDGRGIEDGEDSGSGLGRESMKRRADEIGAQLDVRSTRGEGTEVSIRFRLGENGS